MASSFDGETHWLDVGVVAGLLGTTKPKIVARALAGQFRYTDDGFGQPCLIAEVDIAPLRAAKLAKDRDKANRVRKPREKTPAQWEAHWARLANDNASKRRFGGAFTEHHLRMTLPHTPQPIPDPKTKKKSDQD